MTAQEQQQERLMRRLEDAAAAVDTELAQEGARSLRAEEYQQLNRIVDELETLSMAVVYDEP